MKIKTSLVTLTAFLLSGFGLATSSPAHADMDTLSGNSASSLYDKVNQQLNEACQTHSTVLMSTISQEVADLAGTPYHDAVATSLNHLELFIGEINTANKATATAEATHLESDIKIAQADITMLSADITTQAALTARVQAVINANAQVEAEAEQANNPYGLSYTGYSSIDEARALRNNIEQAGDMYANLSLSASYIGGYGFATSTWLALSAETGTSPTDFSVAHQNLLADTLVRDQFGGDWGNVPTSGGW